jgi:hypothetical protein
MPSRGIAFLAGEYFHLYNRGVDRQAVFFTEENFKHGFSVSWPIRPPATVS